MKLLEEFGVQLQLAFAEYLLDVRDHALADSGDREEFLVIVCQFGDWLWPALNGLRGVAIGTDAKGILTGDLEEVGGFVQDGGKISVIQGEASSE